MTKPSILSVRRFKSGVLAALMAATAATATMSFASASASAAEVIRASVNIRTGGDDLRGGNDNAFLQLTFYDDDGRWSHFRQQVNPGNSRLADYTDRTVHFNLPAGLDPDDLVELRLFVVGFGGGVGGDNWNVDGINVQFSYREDGGAWQATTVMNEFASPLVRFTGDNHEFQRFFDS